METAHATRVASRPRSHLVLLGALVVLMSAGAAAVFTDSPTATPTTLSGDVTAVARSAPTFDVTTVVQSFDPRDAVIALTQVGAGSTLNVVGVRTGQPLATIKAGLYPLAISRPSRSEIIVSDFAPTGGRLFVLDAANNLEIRGSGPMVLPDRIQYTVYGQALVLSADEKILYYLQYIFCGAQCDDYAIGVVDLDQQKLIARAHLPRDCGFGHMTRRGADVVVMCPNHGSLFQVDPAGTVRTLGMATLDRAWPVFGGVSPNGELFVITQGGTLIVQDGASGRVVQSRNLLPPGRRLSGAQRWTLRDGVIALGTKSSAEEMMAGMLLVDANSWSAREYAVGIGAKHAAVVGNGEMLILQDGRMSLIDAVSGLSRGTAVVIPPSTEALIGVAD
jgi:hypothetical protein